MLEIDHRNSVRYSSAFDLVDLLLLHFFYPRCSVIWQPKLSLSECLSDTLIFVRLRKMD